MANAIPLVQTQPRNAISHTVSLVITGAVAQRFPGLIVEPGLSVAVRAPKANSAVVYAADRRSDLSAGAGAVGGIPIEPGTSAGFAVDSLGQIWVQGTAGDRLIATVAGVPIG